MATNLQLVNWANTRTRNICDKIRQTSDAIDSYLADYAAQGIGALAAAQGGVVMLDGSETDGRPPITGTTLVNLQAALKQIQAALTTTLVAGVGTTARAVADTAQVNGSVK